MTLAVMVYMSVKWYREGAGYSAVFAILFVVALGIFFFGRNYKQAVANAAIHTLTLADDAILIVDGALEQRIPYAAIESLRVRRNIFAGPSFTLKAPGVSGSPFYGYVDMDRLIASISDRLPRDRVKDSRVHV
jgi:hypothetical protein